MKVLLGHLDWGLGTKGLHSDQTDKTFLGLYIVSYVSKWSNLLLKMRQKILSLAPVLLIIFQHVHFYFRETIKIDDLIKLPNQ